jgi:hypothetical protein
MNLWLKRFLFLLAVCGLLWGGAGRSVQAAPTVQTFDGEAFSLDLPAGYWGGNPDRQAEEIVAKLEAGTGTPQPQALQWLQANAEFVPLVAFPEQPAAAGDLSNLNVVHYELPKNLTWDQYRDQALAQVQEQLDLRDRQPLNQLPGERWILADRQGEIAQLVYLVPQPSADAARDLWTFTYTSNGDRLEAERAQFEASFATLKFKSSSQSS